MAKSSDQGGVVAANEKVRALEIALEEATERLRLARKAARDAKVVAKAAKKSRKRARKALNLAQQELDTSPGAGKIPPGNEVSHSTSERRIADSPEKKSLPRRKSAATKVTGRDAANSQPLQGGGDAGQAVPPQAVPE